MCNSYRASNGVDSKSIKSLTSEKVKANYLPIMEALFNLPGQGPAEGSSSWIRQQISNIDRVSFYLLSKYPALMKAYVRREVTSPDTDDQGFVTLQPGEEVPNGHYKRLDPSKRLVTHSYSK